MHFVHYLSRIASDYCPLLIIIDVAVREDVDSGRYKIQNDPEIGVGQMQALLLESGQGWQYFQTD